MVQAAGRPLNDARVTLIDTVGGEHTVTAAGYPPKATQVTMHGSGVDSHDIELSHTGE